jgi:hypothetical protein
LLAGSLFVSIRRNLRAEDVRCVKLSVDLPVLLPEE